MAKDEAKPLLKVEDAAKRLNISVRSAWTLISSGKLKRVRVGAKATRIRPQDLERFIERNLA